MAQLHVKMVRTWAGRSPTTDDETLRKLQQRAVRTPRHLTHFNLQKPLRFASPHSCRLRYSWRFFELLHLSTTHLRQRAAGRLTPTLPNLNLICILDCPSASGTTSHDTQKSNIAIHIFSIKHAGTSSTAAAAASPRHGRSSSPSTTTTRRSTWWTSSTTSSRCWG